MELRDLQAFSAKPRTTSNPDGRSQTITAISTTPIETAASHEPAHNARYFGMVDSHMHALLKATAGWEGPIIPDLFPQLFRGADGVAVTSALERILDDSFEPSPTPRGTAPVFNLPTFGMYHAALKGLDPGSHILLLGAANRDINRFKEVCSQHFKDRHYSYHAIQSTRDERFEGDGDASVHYVRDFAEALEDDRLKGKFAAIIMPYSMGSVLEASSRPRMEMMLRLSACLDVGGRVWGSFFDPDALKQLSVYSQHFGTGEVYVKQELPNLGTEGAIRAGFGDKMFTDYRFTPQWLHCGDFTSDDMYMKPAREFIFDHPFPCRTGGRNVDTRLEPVRVWWWQPRSVAEIAEVAQPYVPWEKALKPIGQSVAAIPCLKVDTNRGRPFDERDLFYFDPARTWVTHKVDGYEAVLSFDHKGTGFVSIRGDDAAYGVPWRGPPDMIYQIELWGGSEPRKPQGAVVADVLSVGYADSGYLDRMRLGCRMLAKYRIPITVPEIVKLTTACKFPAPTKDVHRRSYPTDGFVLNKDLAPARRLKDGLGPARYIKFRYTREMQDSAGIYEAALNGDPILDIYGNPKRRPDKTTVTSEHEVAMLTRSWTVAEFVSRIRMMSDYPATLSEHVVRGPGVGGFDFTPQEFLYLWCPWHNMDFEKAILDRWGDSAFMQILSSKARALSRFAKEYGLSMLEKPEAPGEEASAPLAALDFTGFAPSTPLVTDFADSLSKVRFSFETPGVRATPNPSLAVAPLNDDDDDNPGYSGAYNVSSTSENDNPDFDVDMPDDVGYDDEEEEGPAPNTVGSGPATPFLF